MLIVTVSATVLIIISAKDSLFFSFLSCACHVFRSDLAGIEGVVKLKHLDDSNMTVSIDTTDSGDALNPRTKLTLKNATLPLDAKLNGFHDYELKRYVSYLLC